jgi:hypothetical protein
MESTDDTSLVKWAWDQQSIWSKAADRLRQNLHWSRITALVLTAAAAVLVTAVAQTHLPHGAKSVLTWATFTCASLAALSQMLIRPERVHQRMRTRSVSESLKSAVYMYLAGVAPYRGADRDSFFKKNVDAVLRNAGDLYDRIIKVDATPRSLPAVHDVDSYITARVQGQIRQYYRPKSVAMRRNAQFFRVTEVALAVLAAGLSAAAGLNFTDWAVWLPVITTISAAIAAEAAFQRYSVLAVEYARTTAELERLLRDRRTMTMHDAKADDEFVADAERVISQQNEAWMARGLAVVENAAPPAIPTAPQPGAG